MSRRLPGFAGALLLAAGLGGCGGASPGNGVEGKPADAILAASKQAADTASSVHVAGSIALTGGTTTFDLHLARGRGARGRLVANGISYELIRVGSSIYVKGSRAFYRHFTGAAAQLFNGKWLKGRTTSGVLAGIGPLTDLPGFVDRALTQPNLKLTKGAKATVAGQQVVELKDPHGGTLSVAVTGKPYPVRIAVAGGSGQTTTFDRWNAGVALSAPGGSVDIDRLRGGR